MSNLSHGKVMQPLSSFADLGEGKKRNITLFGITSLVWLF